MDGQAVRGEVEPSKAEPVADDTSAVSAIANRNRLGFCLPPATTLVQQWRYRAVRGDDGGFPLHVAPHAASMTETAQDGNLIPHTLLIAVPRPTFNYY